MQPTDQVAIAANQAGQVWRYRGCSGALTWCLTVDEVFPLLPGCPGTGADSCARGGLKGLGGEHKLSQAIP